MNYQFTLEKYNGAQSRYTCPQCNKAQQFVRYVNSQTGELLAPNVGRCNRESKCGYNYTPKQFFEENSLNNVKRPKKFKAAIYDHKAHFPIKIKKTDFIPPEIFRDSLANYEQNAFVQFLLSQFELVDMLEVLKKYFIGTGTNGCTVFWQIDQQQLIRTGKLIAYDPITGKRQKNISPSWIHAELKRKGTLSEDFNLQQCFFGEHLLATESKDKPLAIVESEKTALIASMFLPSFVWLACGGKSNLNAERLEGFRNRRIVLFPDADGFNEWAAKASDSNQSGLEVEISDLLERSLTEEEKQDGTDLGDLLLIAAWREIEQTNALIDKVLTSSELFADFETIVEERLAITEIEGNLSPEDAITIATQPISLRSIVLNLVTSLNNEK